MNQRLKAIYQLISPGQGVIDVGTDHGYIPVQLAKDKYPGRILASDIRKGPLDAAMRSAESAGVADRIDFILCDGLENCPADAVDTIVVAGMGGDTICGILDRAEWCMSPMYSLILQPMTKPEILRFWLVNNGFQISTELLVKDRDIIYQIIGACYTGINEALLDAELFVGHYKHTNNPLLFSELLEREIHRCEMNLKGQSLSGAGSNTLWDRIYKELLDIRKIIHEE